MLPIIAVIIADLATEHVDIPWWLYATMAVAYVIGATPDLV